MKIYNIRVRREYVGYYSILANNLDEAEIKASNLLTSQTDDEIYPLDDFEEFKIMGGTAQGIRILNIFRGMTGEKEIPTMNMQVDGLDKDEVLSRVADPKYATDEVFRKQVEKDMMELEKSGKLS